MDRDTVVALSTPPGSSGIAVIRISGPDAVDILERLAPGADPGDIALGYRGSDGLSLTGYGRLAIDTPLGTLTDERPISFQGETPVISRYRLRGAGYGFALPWGYDRTRPLVIDPGNM